MNQPEEADPKSSDVALHVLVDNGVAAIVGRAVIHPIAECGDRTAPERPAKGVTGSLRRFADGYYIRARGRSGHHQFSRGARTWLSHDRRTARGAVAAFVCRQELRRRRRGQDRRR